MPSSNTFVKITLKFVPYLPRHIFRKNSHFARSRFSFRYCYPKRKWRDARNTGQFFKRLFVKTSAFRQIYTKSLDTSQRQPSRPLSNLSKKLRLDRLQRTLDLDSDLDNSHGATIKTGHSRSKDNRGCRNRRSYTN